MEKNATTNQQAGVIERLQQRIEEVEAELCKEKVQNHRLMHMLTKLNQVNRDREHIYSLIQQLVNNQ